jgi:hypothetical protein
MISEEDLSFLWDQIIKANIPCPSLREALGYRDRNLNLYYSPFEIEVKKHIYGQEYVDELFAQTMLKMMGK